MPEKTPAPEQNGPSSQKVVRVSFLVDILDIATNGIAALLTGSAVMISEFAQGLANFVASGFLMIGLHRAKRPADKSHPLGYGRESYIWNLFAVLLTLFFTAGFSFYIGYERLVRPHLLENLPLAYTVLGIAIISNGYAFVLSVQRLASKRTKQKRQRVWSLFLHSEVADAKTAFVLDLIDGLAALLGVVALLLFGLTGNTAYDAWGAIAIGAITLVLASVTFATVSGLLVGKRGPDELEERVRILLREVPEIVRLRRVHTLLIGPDQVQVFARVQMKKGLTTAKLESALRAIREKVKKDIAEVTEVEIEIV